MQHAEDTMPITITIPIQDELIRYIEKMDEYQARLVLSFIKTLLNLTDNN